MSCLQMLRGLDTVSELNWPIHYLYCLPKEPLLKSFFKNPLFWRHNGVSAIFHSVS